MKFLFDFPKTAGFKDLENTFHNFGQIAHITKKLHFRPLGYQVKKPSDGEINNYLACFLFILHDFNCANVWKLVTLIIVLQ